MNETAAQVVQTSGASGAPGRAAWTVRLQELRRQRWQYCPDLPAVAARWERWWRFNAPRPLLLTATPKRDDIRWDRCYDLLDQPERWLAARRLQVEHTHYAGEFIPYVRVDLGPIAIASCLGAPLHLSVEQNTTWQDPILEDWDAPPSWRIDPENRWFRTIMALTKLAAADAVGRYAVCVPDLAGALDVLSNLRGPAMLCTDLIDRRAEIQVAAMQLVETWDALFSALHEVCLSQGAAVTHWMGCWSDIPHTTPSCDFMALIGPRDFVEVCLPSLQAQSLRAGRCLFHLDGPDAARHARILAEDPFIHAVQYVPGAATPSALAKLDMLKMLQAAGKPLWLYCPHEELEPLCDQLDPRGLALYPLGVQTPEHADRLLRTVERFAA